jgi:preprotein translocase subunit SecA
LNAKQHEREAEIVKELVKKVNYYCNQHGRRGTDIKLGEGVIGLGGLRILVLSVTKVDVLIISCGDDPADKVILVLQNFYVALDDDLMRIFGGDRLKKTMERLGMKPGESIEHRMVSRSIQKAQERVEKHNFDIRKHLIEYDDVLNQQRMVIYRYRREILEGADHILGIIKDMIIDLVINYLQSIVPVQNVQKMHLMKCLMRLKM